MFREEEACSRHRWNMYGVRYQTPDLINYLTCSWEKGSMRIVSTHFRTQRFSNLIMPVNPPWNRVNVQILINKVWDGAGDSVLLTSFRVTPMQMVWSKGHILSSKRSALPLVQRKALDWLKSESQRVRSITSWDYITHPSLDSLPSPRWATPHC